MPNDNRQIIVPRAGKRAKLRSALAGLAALLAFTVVILIGLPLLVILALGIVFALGAGLFVGLCVILSSKRPR